MKKKLLLISIIIIILDLGSKFFVNKYLDLNSCNVIINNFFSLCYTHNFGVAFSLFLDHNLIVVILTMLILFYIFCLYKRESINNKLKLVSYTFIIGGLIGNLYDRIFYNYVRDFLSFSFGNYSFAIFNIADTFIVVGVLMFIVCEFFCRGEKR